MGVPTADGVITVPRAEDKDWRVAQVTKIVQLIPAASAVALYSWFAPNGAEVEEERPLIAWALLEDGSVAGVRTAAGEDCVVVAGREDPQRLDFMGYRHAPRHVVMAQELEAKRVRTQWEATFGDEDSRSTDTSRQIGPS